MYPSMKVTSYEPPAYIAETSPRAAILTVAALPQLTLIRCNGRVRSVRTTVPTRNPPAHSPPGEANPSSPSGRASTMAPF